METFQRLSEGSDNTNERPGCQKSSNCLVCNVNIYQFTYCTETIGECFMTSCFTSFELGFKFSFPKSGNVQFLHRRFLPIEYWSVRETFKWNLTVDVENWPACISLVAGPVLVAWKCSVM